MMLIDGPCGEKMEEFRIGDYVHRFAVNTDWPAEGRKCQRDNEMRRFKEYVDAHSHGQ